MSETANTLAVDPSKRWTIGARRGLQIIVAVLLLARELRNRHRLRVADAAIRFNLLRTQLQAALQTSATTQQMSLLDFLR